MKGPAMWNVTRRQKPNDAPLEYRRQGARVAQYTVRSKHYPMLRWKAVFEDGKESGGHKSAQDAMKYANEYLARDL